MMLNVWAVLSATVTAYLAGALGYSPLFFLCKRCQAHGSAFDQELSNPLRVYSLTFGATLISALILHWLLGPQPTLPDALLTSLMLGAGVVSMSLAVNDQLSERPWMLWLLNSGFHCLRFLLMGLMLALWS